MNPGNNEYQEKVQFYEQQLKDEKLATEKQEREKREQELIAELKNIPASEFAKIGISIKN